MGCHFLLEKHGKIVAILHFSCSATTKYIFSPKQGRYLQVAETLLYFIVEICSTRLLVTN